MNGISETKSIILQNLDNRLLQMEHHGCPRGAVQDEKIGNLEKGVSKIESDIHDKLDQISNRIFWGLLSLSITMAVLAFFAGVNAWQEVPKMFIR